MGCIFPSPCFDPRPEDSDVDNPSVFTSAPQFFPKNRNKAVLETASEKSSSVGGGRERENGPYRFQTLKGRCLKFLAQVHASPGNSLTDSSVFRFHLACSSITATPQTARAHTHIYLYICGSFNLPHLPFQSTQHSSGQSQAIDPAK